MDNLLSFTEPTLNELLIKRSGETKFGEHAQLLPDVWNIYEQLKNLDVDYVILGIPEHVGLFANYGKSDTLRTWDTVIKILLNTQSNSYIQANKTLILGEIDCLKEQEKLNSLNQTKKGDIKKARKLVSKIDEKVSYIIHEIVKAGKIPIVIGGGQNNAYGIIKGISLAKNSFINAVNLDAYADFGKEEGRHSGNGFSYAYAEGFQKNYFAFGLHENYTSDKVFKTINKLKYIQYNTFEDIKVRRKLKFRTELQKALNHVSKSFFGVEIDCNAIEHIPSSSQLSNGFNINNAREFVHFFGSHNNACYLHICEATPNNENESPVGKLITDLITDFIKAKSSIKK